MNYKIIFTLLISIISVTSSSCRDKHEYIKENDDRNCNVQLDGVEVFLGSRDCMKILPKKNMEGYWILDHEYSVFYLKYPSDKPLYDLGSTWIDLSPSAESFSERYIQANGRQVFKVRFIGRHSNVPGIYGPGDFKSGAFVDQFISVKGVLNRSKAGTARN